MNSSKPGVRRVVFVSQEQAEGMRPPRYSCIVSITDTTRSEANLQGGWLGVLRLAFDDVDPITFPGANSELTPFSSAQAEDIARFVLAQATSCKRIFVHCRHGISRSAAVAKAIAGALGAAFPESYAEYNRYVYSLVTEAMTSGT